MRQAELAKVGAVLAKALEDLRRRVRDAFVPPVIVVVVWVGARIPERAVQLE